MTRTFLRLRAIRELTGLTTSSIYEGMKEGWFPRQVKLGPRAVGWDEAEVAAWQEARLAARKVA